MKKLMGTALAAMIIMGQGISAEALEQKEPIRKETGQPKNLLVLQSTISENTGLGYNAGCGNGGEDGDPGASRLFNSAGDGTEGCGNQEPTPEE